jgi:outer membrane immunogenic protein
MKKVLSATIGLLALSAMPAVAANLPVKARPMPAMAPVYNWTGCYVGGNVGGGWARSRNTWSGITEAGTAFAAGAATVLPAAANADLNATGFVAGGQVGCNYQVGGNFLLGIEGDLQYTSFDVTRVAVSLGNTNGGPATIVPGNITESFSSRWLSTIRGRAGFTTGPVLFYATGGAAIANIRLADQLCFPTAGIPICNTAASSDTRLGWTVGGGIEWMFAANWTVKAEYLYVDFGTITNTSLAVAIGTGATPFPGATIAHNHRVTENIARVGVNYKF